jgi:hypothetical protein
MRRPGRGWEGGGRGGEEEEEEESVSLTGVTTSSGRRRLAAHLQQQQEKEEEQEEQHFSRPQQQQQLASQHYDHEPNHGYSRPNNEPPNISQSDEHRHRHTRNRHRDRDKREGDRDTDRDTDTDISRRRRGGGDSKPPRSSLLVHALQTAGASPSPSSPAPSTVQEGSVTGGGNSRSSSSRGVVIPVYHDEKEDDQFLKSARGHIIASEINGSGGIPEATCKDVMVYSETESETESESGCEDDSESDEEESVANHDYPDDTSALTGSHLSSRASSASSASSLSVEEVSVGAPPHTSGHVLQSRPPPSVTLAHDTADGVGDTASERRGVAAPPEPASSSGVAHATSLCSDDGLLRWDDVNDSLAYVKVDKQEPRGVTSRRVCEEGEEGSEEGRQREGAYERAERTAAHTLQRDKENTRGDDRHHLNNQTNNDDNDDKDDKDDDKICSNKYTHEEEPRDRGGGRGGGRGSSHEFTARRGDQKAYELPRGATLDLSGMSFEVRMQAGRQAV